MADDEPNRPIIWLPEAAQSSYGLWLPTGYADRSQPAPASLGFEEVSWQLGHRNSVVTRAVYVHELRTAERTARRRESLERRYGNLLNPAEAQRERTG